MDANDVDEVVQEFLLESYENLDRLDGEFLELEQDPMSSEILAGIFRTIHTIKGTSGFLGFDRLGQLTHGGETLLSRLRGGELMLTQARTSALLALVDAVREILAEIERSGTEGDMRHELVLEALQAAISDEAPEIAIPAPLAEAAAVAGAATGAPAALATSVLPPPDPAPAPEPVPAPALASVSGVTAESSVSSSRSVLSDSTVRVDVALLDSLMTLVGELVLTRNRILQVATGDADPLLHNSAQQLNLVTAELQEGVMKTRLQPIQTVWSRFPRIVRDLAISCEKYVRIEMTGEDTELDRTIVEAIRDPMTHLLRNAVDHGIEPPAVRVAAGKDPEGTIRLRAHHEGSQVGIEMADDGGGIDLVAVGARAVAQGLVTREALERMSDAQRLNLIFEPGLSTAAALTSVSGRGVGMDVVRANIERVGGSVEATTEPGLGTTMRMKIPLTLAIVPALVVTSDDQPFAIPQVSVLELVRLEPERASAIEAVGGARVHRLRGELLPIVDVRDVLGIGGGRFSPPPDDGPAPAAEAVNIVVLTADSTVFGLVVDRIDQTQEIVVKPLGALLADIPVYAGTTIMGDGQVALILDPAGLAKAAKVDVDEINARRSLRSDGPVETVATESLLVCLVGGQRVALALPVINRLEVLEPGQVEWSNGSELVQYHGGRLLRLLRLGPFLAGSGDAAGGAGGAPLRVVVCEHAGELVGLVVDEIVDIVDQPVVTRQQRNDGVVVASAVIGGRVTDLLDVELILNAAATPAMSRW